jgi:hypothetical protein
LGFPGFARKDGAFFPDDGDDEPDVRNRKAGEKRGEIPAHEVVDGYAVESCVGWHLLSG